MTESERYLRKARESLASAQADVRARRYNSAANRAYYAAFQAAVAALIAFRVRSPQTDWQHRFVAEEFSGKLIKRRKAFGQQLSGTINQLFAIRLIADYRNFDVSVGESKSAVKSAAMFVTVIADKLGERALGEAKGEYGAEMTQTKTANPQACVTLVIDSLLRDFPGVKIETHQRGARDFTLDVYGITDDTYEEFAKVYSVTTDILVLDDVWIVVLPIRDNDAD